MTLPSANVSISTTAGATGGGTDLVCVISPVATSDDGVPRLFGSAKAIYEQHGYCDGVEYVAGHIAWTRKPVLFVGIPIATDGAVSSVVTTGNTGTSVITVAAGASGVLSKHSGVLVVERGGTIGTSDILLQLSLDGGRTFKRVRLGTANSYTVPLVGCGIAFAAGTLVTGDTAATWLGSSPLPDSSGYALAFAGLAAQQQQFRTLVPMQEFATDTLLGPIVSGVSAYLTTNQRHALAVCEMFDKPSGDTKAEWMADLVTEFGTVGDDPRIELCAGFCRVTSAFSGWFQRIPAQWVRSWREYQHDLHIATWRKADGPLTGVSLEDADGQVVEWDDYLDGGAATAARFTSLRSYSNGPQGAFVAQALTRAVDGSILGYSHNMTVVNLACSTTQRATEDAIGESLELNDDGTAKRASLSLIEGRVNKALRQALLTNQKGEGPRASSAVWVAATDDILNTVGAVLNGVLTLQLNGTLHTINTVVKVLSGGE